jgi:ribosomal protein S17E
MRAIVIKKDLNNIVYDYPDKITFDSKCDSVLLLEVVKGSSLYNDEITKIEDLLGTKKKNELCTLLTGLTVRLFQQFKKEGLGDFHDNKMVVEKFQKAIESIRYHREDMLTKPKDEPLEFLMKSVEMVNFMDCFNDLFMTYMNTFKLDTICFNYKE